MSRAPEASTPSAPPPVERALVIGYGSIGRRHARSLARVAGQLAVVNRRAEVRARALEEHGSALVAESLEALDDAGYEWEGSAAVIATWGPSHAAFFHALADRGVRRILCEKPMASSVADAAGMAERAEREGIFLGMSHTLRYARLAPALRRFAAAHELGEPVAMVMHGGAACLLTNGIHWLDFAAQLFEEDPGRVVSTACGESINPRSADLMMYGGTAVWSFGESREAVISFSNRSSVFPGARVYYRDAVASVGYAPVDADSYLHVAVRARDAEAVKKYPAVTRTGVATKLLLDGELEGVLRFDAGLDAAAEELLGAPFPTCTAAAGVASTAACIGALAASREGGPVQLPIDPASARGRESWPIS